MPEMGFLGGGGKIAQCECNTLDSRTRGGQWNLPAHGGQVLPEAGPTLDHFQLQVEARVSQVLP